MIHEAMHLEQLLRQISLGLAAFAVGMDAYVLWQVGKSRKMVQHKKLRSFKMMTNAILWLYINQIFVLMAFTGPLVLDRLFSHETLALIDFFRLAFVMSVIGFNVYLIKNYILRALHGELFEPQRKE